MIIDLLHIPGFVSKNRYAIVIEGKGDNFCKPYTFGIKVGNVQMIYSIFVMILRS